MIPYRARHILAKIRRGDLDPVLQPSPIPFVPAEVPRTDATNTVPAGRLAGIRSPFAMGDTGANGWAARGRTFTLERADFARIPDRTWAHVAALRSLMIDKHGIDENRAHRELRMLVELIDDSLPRSTP